MSESKQPLDEEKTAIVQHKEVLEPAGREPPSGATASPVPAPALTPGSILAGRYALLHPLGQGGMGVVMAAYDTRLDRRVALKLLQPRADRSEAAELRLLREAQAMARVSHPNVLPVFDVGTLEDGRIYIAMELVEGQNLQQWQRERPRSWREVLEAYLSAGRGLAAAHAAGLVHRDFKPHNVLVGRDGQVRVTDFGVVRVSTTAISASAPTEPPMTTSGTEQTPALTPLTGRSWEEQLTEPGAVVGTPRYLAPELLTGRAADGRSDLFSFCVALYEALFQQAPFPGGSFEERARAMLAGNLTAPPVRTEVPTWVTRAVLSGLAFDPRERPASMRELLQRLSSSPTQARLRWLVAVATVALVLGITAQALAAWRVRSDERAQLCQGAPRRLVGVWDAAVQARVQQAFVATGKPYAQQTFLSVQQALESHASQWVAQHREACEATRLRGEQSEELLTRRMVCLERRLQELEALGQVLSQADVVMVQKAAQAAQSLPSLRQCADTQALLAEVPPPESGEQQRAVEALRRELAQVQALTLSGRLKQAAEAAEAAVERARPLNYSPVLAEALLAKGRALATFNPTQSLQALTEAAWTANALAQDRLLAAAAVQITKQLAAARRHDELRWWREYTPSLLKRIQGAAELEAEWHTALGIDLVSQGQAAEGLASLERAQRLLAQALGPDHYRTISAEHNAALAMRGLGRYVQAAKAMEHAASRLESLLGSQHPVVYHVSLNLASVYKRLGRYREAALLLDKAAQVMRQNVPENSMEFSMWRDTYSSVELDQGHYAQARLHALAGLEILEHMGASRSPQAASALADLAMALMMLDRYRESLEVIERAKQLLVETGNSEDLMLVQVLQVHAYWHARQGQFAQGLQLDERALALVLKKEGELGETAQMARLYRAGALLDVGRAAEALEESRKLHPQLLEAVGELGAHFVESLGIQGEALVALGRPQEALGLLEQAAKRARESGMDPNGQAGLHFAWARALADAGAEPARVAEQVAQTREALSRSEVPDKLLQVRLERWVRIHPSALSQR
ncbi:protein kinase domain-containing protein [Archangium sp.]|uniref:serine/threonine-protein kinase n=1 Tax=Archangium sp. TaxID=1872627 RepID=UPI00286A1D42|nr:protein kinase [Archangium sp.]